MDGTLTRDENLADTVGLQVAFAAYKKLASLKPQTKLPGLENVTNDQLFFIEFAHVSSISLNFIEVYENFEYFLWWNMTAKFCEVADVLSSSPSSMIFEYIVGGTMSNHFFPLYIVNGRFGRLYMSQQTFLPII